MEPKDVMFVAKAEASMLPKQKAMTEARHSVAQHIRDGMDDPKKQLFERAAEVASKQAEQEFIEREAQDPIERFKSILIEAAGESEQDKKVALYATEQLDQDRAGWNEWIRRNQSSADLKGSHFNLKNELRRDNSFPTFVMTKDGRATFDLMGYIPGTPTEYASDEFMERVLRGLGALKGDQKVNDLKTIHRPFTESNGPKYDDVIGVVSGLPTSMQGVEASIFLKKVPRIVVDMDFSVFQKILNLPNA